MKPAILASVLCLLASCAQPPTLTDPDSPGTAPGIFIRTAAPSPTSSPTPPLTPTPTDPPTVRLIAVGDVMLARSIGDHLLAQGPAAPFAGVASTVAEADVLVANLECAISDRGEPQPKGYTFRAPLAAADSLALAGVDLVSLANNHALDYGPDALADTMQLLSERGIAYTGAGSRQEAARTPVILERNGLHVAFLGYVDVPVEGGGFDTRSWIAGPDYPGVAWAVPEHIASDVAAARALADVVVVLFHFGLESRFEVTDTQRALAHTAIDSGAALVLGSHPHVLQGYEEYQGGLIVYSLGNFVFDGFGFPENYSAIFTATITENGVQDFGWVPVVVENGLPRLATAEEAEQILLRVRPIP